MFERSKHYNVAVKVAYDTWIARVIEEGHGGVEAAANEHRSACVALSLILQLGDLVSVVLEKLKVAVDE